MSTWGIGDNHDSEEVRTLKEQLRTKDAQQETLHGQYLKREAELEEVKASFTEALIKLRQDADRIVQLETNLKKRNEDLSKEQLTRANAETALTIVERKLKESEQTTRELESNLYNLSSKANSTLAGQSKLEKDNTALQTRVRALERELQSKTQAEDTALRRSQSQAASARHRREPSDNVSRIPILESELEELRAAATRQASELQRTTEQLAKTRDELVQAHNEKIATERQLQRQLAEAQAALEDREADLRILKEAHGGEDVVARETGLLERLEEEEERVAALENELARSAGSRKRDLTMLQDELDRTVQLLADANKKAAAAESQLSQLARDREGALRDRQRLQQEQEQLSEHMQAAQSRITELEYQLSTSGQISPVEATIDDQTAANFERLLNTIERLRDERNSLRRDLEFLNAENRFAVQSLEAKLAVATSAPVTPAYTDSGFTTLTGYVLAVQEQADRSARASVALAIVAQHASECDEAKTARIEALHTELLATRQQLQQAEQGLQHHQSTIASLEQQVTSTTGAIGDNESNIASLRSTIQRLENDLANERTSHADTGAALSDTEAQLHAISHALADAEGARDALALEKTHLEADLDAARQELADAEERHSEQLNALSAGTNSGHGPQAVLRAHIHELEDRVQRRTEQIGIHQHDIKRMEINMKLQEERLAELVQELDVAQSEREAMLEDCRTTREQRDEATRRCEELEEAMEGVEEFREQEVEAMVGVTFDLMAAKRATAIRSRQAVSAGQAEIARLQGLVHTMEHEMAALSPQLAALTAERDQLAQAVHENSSLARSQLEDVSAKIRIAEESKSALESQLAAARSELEAKDKELASLQSQLDIAHANDTDRQTMQATLFAQEKADLQAQLQQTQSSLAESKSLHQQTVDSLKRVEEDLKRAEDELACHLASSNAHSEAEERLRAQIEELRQQHAAEVDVLEEQLKNVLDELDTITRHRDEADASRQAVEQELAQTKEQLQARLAEAGETLGNASRLEAELDQLKTSHGEQLRNLRAELDALTRELEDVTHSKEELESMHERALSESQQRNEEVSEVQKKAQALETELAGLRATHAQELMDLRKQLEDADRELQDIKASADAQRRDAADELSRAVQDLQTRLTALTKEADECRMELCEEKAAHARTRESATAELKEISAMRDEAESALAEAEDELPTLRAQLEHAEASLRDMEELQYHATNLEAEVQRAKSLQRFLESRVTEGERRAAALEVELEELRTQCTTLDKCAQNTEANLAMQTIQHEQTVAVLRRELNHLRSQPSLEEAIDELREKNAEYEELLRAKCLEIEENDDKFIDMLKEKKKLNSKIDSLSRKVQNLQTKLAAATEAASKAAEAPAPPTPVSAPLYGPPVPSRPPPPSVFSPSVLAPAAIITGSASSSRLMSRQRVVTAPAISQPEPIAIQPPPMPSFRPKTPESSRKRMMSGPSSIARPKTPESRIPSQMMFKAQTPERHRVATSSSLPESSSSSSLIGVKRRAPDDFDDCAAMPPQTFTADSAPSGHAATLAEPTTPRLRRALQTMRTGFTPNRHTTRAGSASPRRATTGTPVVAAPTLPTIVDVTNSPRSAARHEPAKAAAKKGWLGKLKSAPSQPPRGYPARQPLFDAPGGMR